MFTYVVTALTGREKIKINYIKGSLERMGSTSSEQNHSSVIINLNQGDCNHKYFLKSH